MAISWDKFRKMILEKYKHKPDDFPFSLGPWNDGAFEADYRIDLGQFRRNEYSGDGLSPHDDPTLLDGENP